MAFTRVTKDAGVISALNNKPNTSDGLTPAALKAKFDELGAALKAYLNETLCAELEANWDDNDDPSDPCGAESIGISQISTWTETTVQAALEKLKAEIDGVTAGAVGAGGITATELAEPSVTTSKIYGKAVTTGKIDDGAVTATQLASNAVENAKIKDGAVTEGKLAGASVTAAKLGAKAVGTAHLADDLVVPVANGGTGSTSAADARTALGAQKAISKSAFSLTVAGWDTVDGVLTQAVNITGMTASSEFVASPPDAASWDAAADAGLKPPTAGSGTLTFTCDTTPDDAISVTVYWW